MWDYVHEVGQCVIIQDHQHSAALQGRIDHNSHVEISKRYFRMWKCGNRGLGFTDLFPKDAIVVLFSHDWAIHLKKTT